MSKPTIPDWQRTATTNAPPLSADEEPKPESAADNGTEPVAGEAVRAETAANDVKSEEDLLDQARRFLEDANIRHAPREKKAVFLQAKGVSSQDIETLLGKATQQDVSPDLEAAGARAWLAVSLFELHASPPPQS